MNNTVYEPPKSDLGESGPFKRSVAWKIYFVFYVLISILGVASLFFIPDLGWAEYIGVPISILATVGLFGFTFLKRIYTPKFWFFVFIVNVLYFLIYCFMSGTDLEEDMSEKVYYISQAIGFLLYLPMYIGLYLYSKADDPAWKTD